MSLQEFLVEMGAEGQSDSEGQFTVNLEKASWKLAQFRLGHRHDFALHVLSCAVLSGAKAFSVESTEEGVQLHFEGRPFETAELAWLSRQSEMGVTSRVKELQIAISAAGAFERVEVSINSGGVKQTLKVNEGSVTTYPVPVDTRPGLTFSVKTEQAQECVARVNRRGRFAPLDLVLNEVEVNRHLDFGLMRSEVYAFHHTEGMEDLRFRAPEKSPTRPWISRKKSDRSPSLLLCLVDPKQAREEKFYFLSGGVTLEQEKRPFKLSLLQGAVTVTHLDKDFGQTALVRKQSFEDFQLWLLAEVDHFLRGFCAHAPRLPKLFEKKFRSDLRIHFRGRDQPLEVQAYLSRGLGSPHPVTRERLKEHSQQRKLEVESRLERGCVEAWHEADFANYLAASRDLSKLRGQVFDQPMDQLASFLAGREIDLNRLGRLVQDSSQPSESRFRALMAYQSKLDEEEFFTLLQSIDGVETWAQPLEVLSRRTPRRAHGEFWLFLRALLQGDWSATDRLVGIARQHSDLRDDYRFWHSAFSKHARGKMTWADQIRVTIQVSLLPNRSDEAISTEIARKLWIAENFLQFCELAKSQRDELLHSLVLLALKKSAEAKSFPRELLCQTLLWRSLCGDEKMVSFCSPLPTDPFGLT